MAQPLIPVADGRQFGNTQSAGCSWVLYKVRLNPQWEAELGKRLDRCLEGKGHAAKELLAIHERLSSEGR